MTIMTKNMPNSDTYFSYNNHFIWKINAKECSQSDNFQPLLLILTSSSLAKQHLSACLSKTRMFALLQLYTLSELTNNTEWSRNISKAE